MYKHIRANERGSTLLPWLRSYHSFSFNQYYDPARMGFGPLRVVNQDWVAPGGGFSSHSHRDDASIEECQSRRRGQSWCPDGGCRPRSLDAE